MLAVTQSKSRQNAAISRMSNFCISLTPYKQMSPNVMFLIMLDTAGHVQVHVRVALCVSAVCWFSINFLHSMACCVVS